MNSQWSVANTHDIVSCLDGYPSLLSFTIHIEKADPFRFRVCSWSLCLNLTLLGVVSTSSLPLKQVVNLEIIYYFPSSFPEGARSYRFNHTRLPKNKKKTLKVTKLTICMIFRCMTQAVINVLDPQQSRESRRMRTTCSAVYLHNNVNKYTKNGPRRNDITQGWEMCSF